MASLLSAPDELLAKIIELLPSNDVATSVQRVNRRLHRLSNDPSFWHARCLADYRYWDIQYQAHLDLPFHATIGCFYKSAWLRRRRLDACLKGHFEQVLSSKVRRVQHILDICWVDVEAKDFLLAQMGEDAFRGDDLETGGGGGDGSDILARRYYASMCLSSINRFLGIQEWMHVRSAQHDPATSPRQLERAMAALDMFVLHDAPHDVNATVRILDQLAADFVAAHTAADVRQAQASGRYWELDTSDPLHHLTIRQRALALVRWLRSRGLVGTSLSREDYRNLRNFLLGHALTDPEHPSLPIVAATIFVAVARRIGLNAHCCAVPGHVHCTVLAAPSATLDSVPLPSHAGQEQEQEQEQPVTAATATAVLGRPTLPPIPSTAGSLMGGSSPSVAAEAQAGRCMFLDPYGSDDEVPVADLLLLIPQTGFGPHFTHGCFLGPSPTAAMVLRLGLNIEISLGVVRQTEANVSHTRLPPGPDTEAQTQEILSRNNRAKQLRRGDADMNVEALKYATMWMGVLMRPLHGVMDIDRLETLLKHIAAFYSEDAWIVQRFLSPLYYRFAEDTVGRAHEVWGNQQAGLNHGWFGQPPYYHQLMLGQPETSSPRRPGCMADPHDAIAMILNVDRRPAEVSRRYTQEINNTVRFRVGQVVRHRRYGYVSVIYGWKMQSLRATSAGAPTTTTTSSGLPGVRPLLKEAFYWCLATGNLGGNLGGRSAMVAQTSLELVTNPAVIPRQLFFIAGRYFKRFDRATCTFVSNVRESFPDD